MIRAWKRRSLSRRRELRLAAGLVAPAILIMALVAIYPIFRSFWISLTEFDLLDFEGDHPFVGLDNYAAVLKDPAFWDSALATLIFVVMAVTLEITLALAIALLLNKDFRGKSSLRILVLLPWAIPPVVTGVMWKWILNPSFGALNGLLYQLGIIGDYIIWLGEPLRALIIVALVDTWKETPFIMLMILAALQSVPKGIYEAAKVDGASALRTMWSITIPMIRPTLFVVISLRTIWALKSFDLIYTITSGGPSGGTTVLGYYTYLEAFVSLRMDRGSAAAMIMAAVVMVVVLLYQRALYKEVGW